MLKRGIATGFIVYMIAKVNKLVLYDHIYIIPLISPEANKFKLYK